MRKDQIEVFRWLQLLVGARYDNFDLTALDINTNINRQRTDDFVSPRAAVIFKPIDPVSLYTAWSDSYLPASGDQFSALSTSTIILDPQHLREHRNWREVERKYKVVAFSPGCCLSNPARQRANQYRRRSLDPRRLAHHPRLRDRPDRLRHAGLAVACSATPIRMHGLPSDLTATGITPPIVQGNRVQLVPYNQVSWWNKYQFNPTWAAALGVIYFSDSFASSDDTVRLPGFVRVDAAVYAKIDEMWRVQLNIENIFNKGYWATADGDNNISPGQGRTVRLSAIARF